MALTTNLARNAVKLVGVMLRTTLAIVAVQCVVATAGASAATTPAANMPITALPAACTNAPTGAVCTNAVVVALDGARANLGLSPYALPADFDSLSGPKQLLILSNLDRLAYGLPPIEGLSPTLDKATQTAMTADVDPDPTSLLSGLSDYAWTSNWAGQWANAPYAYYEWMYDDGYGGNETTNIDCASQNASGCWDHRRDVLALPNAGTLAMGASVGLDANGDSSYTMTLVWTTSTDWTTFDYTWAQAQVDGAGHTAPLAHQSSKPVRHVGASGSARTAARVGGARRHAGKGHHHHR
jgi:hypothetical protein